MAPASICQRKALPPAGAADGHLGPPADSAQGYFGHLRPPLATLGFGFGSLKSHQFYRPAQILDQIYQLYSFGLKVDGIDEDGSLGGAKYRATHRQCF